MLVIINADDLGANQEVNDTIFRLMSVQSITSATLLANGPGLIDASKQISHFPECSFGVHLNVTQFQPLLRSDALAPLVDEEGFFCGEERIREIKITSSLSYAIYEEFCAQCERILSLGVNVSHIDSHHHIHTIPRIFPILKRLQTKYGLRKVRISRNIYPDDHKISKTLLLKKRFYNFMLRNYYCTKTTSGFTDMTTFYKKGKGNDLRHHTMEVMVHPGARGCEREMAVLQSGWREEVPFRIKLISYKEL